MHKNVFLKIYKLNVFVIVIYMRPLQTNEPEKDKMIPETYTSVIAAIGTLNSNGEANTHQSSDRTTQDIRIDFNSRNVHECTNSLYNLPESNEIDPWPIMEVMDTDEFIARIGPTGGKRGYSYITGKSVCLLTLLFSFIPFFPFSSSFSFCCSFFMANNCFCRSD